MISTLAVGVSFGRGVCLLWRKYLIEVHRAKKAYSFVHSSILVDIIQLHFLRDRLTSGLQTHFVHNTMIHSILPATAILYSPGSGGGGFSASGTFSGSKPAGSQVGSRAGSRAGSRPSSSMGHYADAADAKEELDRVDRKYLNAEMAKMRQVQRKKDRTREKFDDY